MMFNEKYNVEISLEGIIDIGAANDKLSFIVKLLEEDDHISRCLVKELRHAGSIYESYLTDFVEQIDNQED